jgi:hypothetical protein
MIVATFNLFSIVHPPVIFIAILWAGQDGFKNHYPILVVSRYTKNDQCSQQPLFF